MPVKKRAGAHAKNVTVWLELRCVKSGIRYSAVLSPAEAERFAGDLLREAKKARGEVIDGSKHPEDWPFPLADCGCRYCVNWRRTGSIHGESSNRQLSFGGSGSSAPDSSS